MRRATRCRPGAGFFEGLRWVLAGLVTLAAARLEGKEPCSQERVGQRAGRPAQMGGGVLGRRRQLGRSEREPQRPLAYAAVLFALVLAVGLGRPGPAARHGEAEDAHVEPLGPGEVADLDGEVVEGSGAHRALLA